jgi:hypothetical protein
MLILFLQIKGHCGKYETAYVEHIIASLLISSAICSTQTSREVLRYSYERTYSIFSCLRTILMLQYQTIKFAPLSFSLSSKDRKLKADVLLADMIYSKK